MTQKVKWRRENKTSIKEKEEGKLRRENRKGDAEVKRRQKKIMNRLEG